MLIFGAQLPGSGGDLFPRGAQEGENRAKTFSAKVYPLIIYPTGRCPQMRDDEAGDGVESSVLSELRMLRERVAALEKENNLLRQEREFRNGTLLTADHEQVVQSRTSSGGGPLRSTLGPGGGTVRWEEEKTRASSIRSEGGRRGCVESPGRSSSLMFDGYRLSLVASGSSRRRSRRRSTARSYVAGSCTLRGSTLRDIAAAISDPSDEENESDKGWKPQGNDPTKVKLSAGNAEGSVSFDDDVRRSPDGGTIRDDLPPRMPTSFVERESGSRRQMSMIPRSPALEQSAYDTSGQWDCIADDERDSGEGGPRRRTRKRQLRWSVASSSSLRELEFQPHMGSDGEVKFALGQGNRYRRDLMHMIQRSEHSFQMSGRKYANTGDKEWEQRKDKIKVKDDVTGDSGPADLRLRKDSYVSDTQTRGFEEVAGGKAEPVVPVPSRGQECARSRDQQNAPSSSRETKGGDSWQTIRQERDDGPIKGTGAWHQSFDDVSGTTTGMVEKQYLDTFDSIRSLSLHPTSTDVKYMDAFLKVQLLNLSLMAGTEAAGEEQAEGVEHHAFRQFSLLSVAPGSLLSRLDRAASSDLDPPVEVGTRFLDPFVFKTADLLDQFPKSEAGVNDSLAPDALSTFCFPQGLRMRVIPRCALEGAKRLGWVGKKADRYHLLAFTNVGGITSHGVALTVREEIASPSGLGMSIFMDAVSLRRTRRRAAVLICRWWRTLRKTRFAVKNFSHRKVEKREPLPRRDQGPAITGQHSEGILVAEGTRKSRPYRSRIASTGSIGNPNRGRTTNGTVSDSAPTPKKKGVRKKLKERIRKGVRALSSSDGKIKDEGFGGRLSVGVRSGKFRKSSRVKDEMSLRSVSCSEIPYVDGDEFPLHKEVRHREPLSSVSTEGTCNQESFAYSGSTLRQAAGAYLTMREADKLGDLCVVEKCYVLIGGRSEEQSLLFSALQRMADMDREENALCLRSSNRSEDDDRRKKSLRGQRESFKMVRNPRKQNENGAKHGTQSFLQLSEKRHALLSVLQTKLCLTAAQSRVRYPRGEHEHLSRSLVHFELDLPLRGFSKITHSLPLPHIAGQWGLARLLLGIKFDSLILVLKLLLLERSVLVLGSSYEEVTSCTCALIEMLKPYKWSSSFMPLLPQDMLDFVNSPVPFVAGMVAEDARDCVKIQRDVRTRTAMSEGLSVVNLSVGKLTITTEEGIKPMLSSCPNPRLPLECYQTRIEELAEHDASALCSLKSFVTKGLSPKESLTLHSVKCFIETHMKSLSGHLAETRDGWQQYGKFNNRTKTFDFYPSKFVAPLRSRLQSQLQFQEMMAHTQLFVEYVEEMRNDYLEHKKKMEGSIAVFIADWVYFRWFRKRGVPFLERE